MAAARALRRGRAGGGARGGWDADAPARVLDGGAVAITAADEPTVERVVGLAPWIPDRLDVSPLRGKRLDVVHGSFDGRVPGLPGVAPSLSRRGFERVRELGAAGEYTLIPGALHAIALRVPGRGPVPLPRAERWAALVARQLELFAETETDMARNLAPT